MTKSKLIQMLNELSPEDMSDIIISIQNKLENKEQKPRKQHRHKTEEPVIEKPERRRSFRRKADTFDLQKHREARSRGRSKKGSSGRVESLQTGPRPNDFDKMPERFAHKKDVLIDQKLSGRNQPTERRPPIDYIAIRCKRCNTLYEILKTQCYYDVDDGLSYICDSCTITKNE